MADELMTFWKHSQIRCNIFESEGSPVQNFLFSAVAGLMMLSIYQYLKSRGNGSQDADKYDKEMVEILLTLDDLKDRLASEANNSNSLDIKARGI